MFSVSDAQKRLTEITTNYVLQQNPILTKNLSTLSKEFKQVALENYEFKNRHIMKNNSTCPHFWRMKIAV